MIELLKSYVKKGDLGSLKRLLKERHLPLDTPDPQNGWPMLYYAIAQHQHHIVQYLIDPNHTSLIIKPPSPPTDFNNNTPLLIAVEYGNKSAVDACLAAYPDDVHRVNSNGADALILAAIKGDHDLVVRLLQVGMNVNSKDSDGSTPLHHASAYGHVACIDVLLHHGANRAVLNKKGWSPIDYSFSFGIMEQFKT